MKFGGMEIYGVRRLKELEAENARLRRIVARQARGFSSRRRACGLVEVSRSSLYYVPRKRPDDDALRARIWREEYNTDRTARLAI